MLLSKVEKNSVIFIDTNIFLYNISLHPVHGDTCKAFLKRIEKGELSGKTNVIVLNELLHKLILGEVSLKYNITLSQSAGYIKKNPDILSSLDVCECYNIVDFATNDKDFQRVFFLKVWNP